jgi:hypothetical protein
MKIIKQNQQSVEREEGEKIIEKDVEKARQDVN